jgi:hypothetical protein
VLPQTIQLTVRQTDNGPIVDCGNGVYLKEYLQVRDIKQVVQLLGMKNKIDLYMQDNPAKSIKDRYSLYNRAVFSITHVPQRSFVKLVQGKLFQAFVKPIPEKIKMRLCFGPGGVLSTRRIKAVHKTLPLLIQAVEDGQDNILPYILHFKKPPDELKKLFGKGLWKQVCALSFSRNKAIVSYISGHPFRDSYDIPKQEVERIRNAIALPTTLITHFVSKYHDGEEMIYAKLHCKGQWGAQKVLQDIFTIYRDTADMRKRYDNKDSKGMLEWSVKRLKAEHEAYIKRSFLERYSDKPFEWSENLLIGQFSYKDFEVTPLLSEMAIGVEGQAMQHCVGMYAGKAAKGEYLVFSVKKDGERFSTIGLRMLLGGRAETFYKPHVAFDQHYMRFNQPVEDKVANEIPPFIIQSILKS